MSSRTSTVSPAPPDIARPLALLGDLSPETFMRRHWQKKPLLIRQAVPGVQPPLDLAGLQALAAQEEGAARLVRQTKAGWTLQSGPLAADQWPAAQERGWTVLVQGVDRQVPAAQALLAQFRFVPDARLDDLMVSFAGDGGGVGPHFDSYDVFLLQVQGHRRWRIGRLREPQLLPDSPLKILSHFEPEEEWLLAPGDMLYLPPRWAHDGVAEGGECMTCSIGFRAPAQDEFAREVLQRLLDAAQDEAEEAAGQAASVRHSASPLYRDPKQPATVHPGRIPPAMQGFAEDAMARLLADPQAQARALGEWLSEPAAGVWFDEGPAWASGQGLRVDPRTRLLYDDHHVFINGESYRAGGRDATLIRQLADRRVLSAAEAARLSPEARDLLAEWVQASWLHGQDTA
ncbi:MAG: cupin domain-containing protein [Pseudomonadota bacterium]